MIVPLTGVMRATLRERGVETFHGDGATISSEALFEPPCSIKWMAIESSFRLGAFSYAVSGYFSCVSIGRYTSIGESVQIGRGSHPTDWVSTSPFFYLADRMFDVGEGFEARADYTAYRPDLRHGVVPTRLKPITIGNDVYVGHGAMIMPGVTIGDGAIVAANSVVTKNVPPFAIVGGNPAHLIRFRLEPIVFSQLLQLQWWRFAPWQLKNVDFSNPESAIDQLRDVRRRHAAYEATLVQVAELMQDRVGSSAPAAFAQPAKLSA